MANNGKSSAKISQNLLDAFEIMAKAQVDSAQFDKTVTGIIVSCEDKASGRYKVQYQDSIFYAYSSALDVTYMKGTSVQVKIPNNDFSGRKIIIGTATEGGIDYGTIVEDPLLRYENIGADCVRASSTFELGSYWTEQRDSIIYDRNRAENPITLDQQMIAENMQQGDSVLLGCSIQTSIPEEQRFRGNYGLIYTLTFNDISNVSATVDRYYIVDIDQMSGDPYAYTDEVEQLIPFDIDSKNFLYIKKIEAFVKDFRLHDDTQPADIMLRNIHFQVANKLSDEEFAGTALTVFTPEGNYFKEVENNDNKEVIAQLRIKGKITDGVLKKIQYYWFIEDLTVDRSSNIAYQKYGGRGWRCLNEYNVTDGDDDNPNSIQYISGKDSFIIKKSNSNARETKYKVVVLYNGSILEKEFIFTNYDVTDLVEIIADRNPNFIDSIGATTLTCMAITGHTYKWVKVDAEGGLESLSDTTAANAEYNHAVLEYNNLKTAIQNETKPDNETNRALLVHYQEIINSYDTRQRIEENRIINIQAGTIFQEATFKCQAFNSDGISLGIASQRITNSLRAGEEEQRGMLVINNGTQVFKYDAKGIAPTSEIWENPQIIPPLSFTLRTAEGIEVPLTALRDTDILWKVPIKDTLLKDYIGSIVSHDEELGIEIYNGKSLSYNISENYYTNKDNNEIELQVRYQGILYIAKTNLLFTKDGDTGTNGTDYVLKIIPDAETIGRLKVAKNGEEGSTWLKIQLWYNGIKIYEGYSSGISTLTGKNVDLTWSMVGDARATHNITVTSNGTNWPVWRAAAAQQTNATDIAKATVQYDGMTIVATMPIIYTTNLNSGYKVSLRNNTGYTHVIYSEDGLTPNYESKSPFEIVVHKKINSDWGDITGYDTLTYQWSTIGNLSLKRGSLSTDESVLIEPISGYESETTHHAVVCTIKEGNVTVATLHIPVHFLLNTYGHAAINEWDGNSIQLDADGNTMLLAPQAGFGKKENDGSNTYTGVLLGTVKDYSNNGLIKTGMFGYKAGVRTFILDSEQGSAIFGSIGSAQIVIDPTQDRALLYNNKFYKNYDTKTGLPTSYGPNNERGEGALIDLTTPEIRWGNRNFSVNADGWLVARGGGSIAGWTISDTALYKEVQNGSVKNNVILSSDASMLDNYAIQVKVGSKTMFGAQYSGLAVMRTAQIGDGTNLIIVGKDSSGANSAIRYIKQQLTDNRNGFYIGNDGFALGGTADYKNVTGSSAADTHSKFEVLANGTLYANNAYLLGAIHAKEGYIGNNSTLSNNWKIAGRSIQYNKTGYSVAPTSGTNGAYIGTDGIGLGALNNYKNASGTSGDDYHSMFEVSSSGKLYAKNGVFDGRIYALSGNIGGWTINTSSLSANGITINSNGSLTGGTDYAWSITKNGKATFSSADISGKITATSGKIAGYTINGDILYGSQVGMDAESGGHYAFWAGASVNNTENAPFRVGHDGSLRATSADITGNINATSGTFRNVTVTDSCSVPASTITGTLAQERIPNLSASKITSGTMSANRISGGTLSISTSGGGSFSAGTNGRKNAYASGLTTGEDGIDMQGQAGIGGCANIGNDGAVFKFSGTTISTQADLKVSGSTNFYVGDRTLSTYVNDVCNGHHPSGVDKQCWLEVGAGGSYPTKAWKLFTIKNGVITEIQ